MVAAYRAGGTFGQGQTATVTSLPIVIPAAAQVGDVAVVTFTNNVDTRTIATPAGWTALDSQVNTAPNSNTEFLFAKEVAAGEPGSTVTFTSSGTGRYSGTITVYSGVTLTGYVLAKAAQIATTTAPVLPTAASVPTGAMIVANYGRRVNVTGNAAGTVTFPGYTAAVAANTAYTSSPNTHTLSLYKIAGAGGSYGGETGTASVTGFGTEYVLALPATGGGGSNGQGSVTGSWSVTAAAVGPVTLPGLIDGIEPEAHGHVPPFVDGNGNLYRVTEEYGALGGPVQVTDGTHNQPRMMKSADGGVTWVEMDKANRPTDNDLESGWMIQAGTVLYYIFTDGGFVSFNSYNTSDAASNPDKWVVKNEKGITGLSAGSQQFASAVRLSDGRFRVAFSDTTAGNIAFITRAAAGGWSAKTSLGSGNSRGPVMIVGASDKVHEFHHDYAAKTVQYRTITSADVLSAAVRADTTGTDTATRNYNAVGNPVYYDAAGTEVVAALFASASGLRLVSVVGGVVQAEQVVDSNAPLISPANTDGNSGNDGPVCHLAVDGTTLHAIWTEASTGNVYRASRPHGGSWSARTLLWSAPAGRHGSWVYCNVYTRAGQRVLGYTYDDGPHEDNDSNIWYNQFTLTVPIPQGSATGTWSASGSVTGKRAPVGATTRSWSATGSATGSRTSKGTGTGAFAATGSASGAKFPKGSRTGTFTAAGSASGAKVSRGSTVSSWSTAGTAAGKTVRSGTSSGSWSTTSSAVGGLIKAGSSTGTWSAIGTAAGKRVAKGGITGAWSATATAAGSRTPKGSTSSSWSATGSVAGSAPAVGAKTGSVTGSWTASGAGTANTQHRGAATGAWAATGSATSTAQRSGSATGAWTVSATAAGKIVRAGAASRTWTAAGTATGKRVTKGSATRSWSASGVAVGGTASAAFTENFEDGTDGATVTTTNTDFTLVDAGWTFTDTPTPAQGSLCVQVDAPALTATALRNTFTPMPMLFRRFYVRLTSYPTGGTIHLAISRGAGVSQGQLRLNTAGQLIIRNGATTVWTSPTALPLNKWVRIEWMLNCTAGQQQVRVFHTLVDGLTPDADSNTVALTVTGDTDEIRMGVGDNNSTTPLTVYFDAVRDGTAWPGPANTPTTGGGATGSWTATAAAVGETVGVQWMELFEGGTPGAVLDAGNTAFSAVDPGWSFTDSPVTAQGALAARLDVAANETSVLTRNFAGPTSLYFYRFYMFMPSYPLNTNGINYLRTASGAIGGLRMSTAGALQLRDGSTTVWTSTPLSRYQWVRVEVMVDSVNHQLRARLFTNKNVHGTVPDQDSGIQTFTAANPIKTTFGCSNGSAGPWAVLYDAVADSTSDWVGPDPAGNPAQNSGFGAWSVRGAAQGQFAVPSTPTLLARPTKIVIDGVLTTKYTHDDPVPNSTFDLRDAEFQGYFWADAIFGFGTFSDGAGGTTATEHQKNSVPLSVGDGAPASGTAIIGGKITGDQPSTLTWNSMKHGSHIQAAIDGGMTGDEAFALIVNNQNQDGDSRVRVASGSWALVDGLRSDNTHDGFGLYSENDNLNDVGTVYFRNCWFRNVHDDSIENDRGYLTVDINDCLFEEIHCFISVRAGNTAGEPASWKPQKVSNSIIWHKPRPGPHKQPSSVVGQGNIYKMQTNSPPLIMKDCIIAVDTLSTSDQANLPVRPGLDSYENVTLVWLGTGAYPGNVPAGCTLTTDRTVLDNAVAKWKVRHGVTSFDTVNMAFMIDPLVEKRGASTGNHVWTSFAGMPQVVDSTTDIAGGLSANVSMPQQLSGTASLTVTVSQDFQLKAPTPIDADVEVTATLRAVRQLSGTVSTSVSVTANLKNASQALRGTVSTSVMFEARLHEVQRLSTILTIEPMPASVSESRPASNLTAPNAKTEEPKPVVYARPFLVIRR